MKKPVQILLFSGLLLTLVLINIKGMAKLKDLTGKVYHRLTVLSCAGKLNNHHYFWNCLCECGNITTVNACNLKRTKSCGCYSNEIRGKALTTHGETHKTKEYRSWASIRNRCTNKKSKSYHDYGGRGITVCDRWSSYQNFLKDMGRAPSPIHSIDRKENDKGYSKENCRWATKKEQANNRRSNLMIQYKGQTKTLGEWCDIFNLKWNVARHRLYKGWTIERTLETKHMHPWRIKSIA